jgi:hypothetical protein
MAQIHHPREIKEISSKGKELFQKLDAELHKQYYGKFMAMDAESGDYFLGATMIEADTQARAKYPGKVFYVGRIGYRAAIKYHGSYAAPGGESPMIIGVILGNGTLVIALKVRGAREESTIEGILDTGFLATFLREIEDTNNAVLRP